VAISGTTVVVGALDHANDAGRAYVFVKTANGWTGPTLKGSNTVAGDFFGGAVAISGTTAIVGAGGHANNAGRAYLFQA
jgi:L-lactate permease